MGPTPRILLLDEPAAGMNPVETHEITELIGKLRDDRLHHFRHRTRHASRRGHLGPGRRARPRSQDRGGHLRRGGDEPPSGRGVPRRARGRRRDGSERRRPLHRPRAAASSITCNTYYGQIHILNDVCIKVGAGELVCLLGGNASGKSTTLKTCLGIVKPRAGRVVFEGDDISDGRRVTGSPGAWRSCPKTDGCSAPMTVLENLQMGAYLRGRRTSARTTTASTVFFRCSTSAAPSSPAPSPAESSRWWQWPAR